MRISGKQIVCNFTPPADMEHLCCVVLCFWPLGKFLSPSENLHYVWGWTDSEQFSENVFLPAGNYVSDSG